MPSSGGKSTIKVRLFFLKLKWYTIRLDKIKGNFLEKVIMGGELAF